MNELEGLRKQIDQIDQTIVHAFEQRLQLAEKVADYKIKNNMAVLDSAREKELLKKREAMLQDASLKKDVRHLFELLMNISRNRQQGIIDENQQKCRMDATGVVGYQGVKGAYSEQALDQYFSADVTKKAFASFDEVFSAIDLGEIEYGVVPIENSYAGSVAQVYDLFHEHALYIVGEFLLKIEHALLGIPGSQLYKIKRVYSHEQGLAQCADFLKEHKNWELYPYYNTAASAQLVFEQQDESLAAIASKYAAEAFNLEVLQDNISSSGENTTRFVILKKTPYQGLDANKASVCFTLEHKTGSLARVLNIFAEYGLNMVKIESRPMRLRNFEYLFYVDFEGEEVAAKVEEAKKKAQGLFSEYRLLGSYRK